MVAYAIVEDRWAVLDGVIIGEHPKIQRDGFLMPIPVTVRTAGPFSKADVDPGAARWPGGIVPYLLSPDFPEEHIQYIQFASRELWKRAGIQLVPATVQGDYVVFTKSNSVCNSNVGRQGGPQVINLAANCITGYAVVHEVMHALGWWHEQQRPDRDSYVTIHPERMTAAFQGSGYTSNYGIFQAPVGAYDFDSLMHYSLYAACNSLCGTAGGGTMVPKVPLPFGVIPGKLEHFSRGDIDSLQAVYGTTGFVPFKPVNLKSRNSVLALIAEDMEVFATLRRVSNFNGDDKSDLLYRNFSTGQVYRLLMDGFSLTNAALAYTEPNTAWTVVADADFNGDGVADLLWRNNSTGQVFLQPFSSSGTPNGGAIVYTEPNPAWKIIQTPDIDGDGKADILWWNSTTGQVFGMLMNGPTIVSQGMIYTEPNVAWRVVAVGDFAGSGKTNQLLWRNNSTGQVYLMTVTVSGGVFAQTGAMIYTEPNTAWRILAAPDLDGDTRSDILWRNDSTGQVFAMLMNGSMIASQGMIYSEPNVAWKIVAQGDYNGDGRADLLYRNETTGQVYMMLMNGLTIASQASVYSEPNTAWKLMGPWEYAQ